jgi:SAM-dependent methyltransferase
MNLPLSGMPQNAAQASAAAQLDAYRDLYARAPSLETHFELTSQEAYDYCLARLHFVLILPYTADRKILVERIFSYRDITWAVLGGSLRPDRAEDFIDAASRLARFNLESVDLADIEPIAFLTNDFRFAGHQCSHRGIAFVARLRNSDVIGDLHRATRTRGHLIGLDTPSTALTLEHNAKAFELAKQYLAAKGDNLVPFHDHEVEENLRYQRRYRFHDLLVKPVLRVLSHLYFPASIADLERRIDSLILDSRPHSVVDVACGENTLSWKLASRGDVPLVVGNDVSWSQIELIHHRAVAPNSVTSLIYTNHDATAMPFPNDTFDVAICKNVLHHLPDTAAVDRLIDEAIRVARRAIIIEVMDPAFESRWGRLRHRYYLEFLHDSAVHFYSRAEFDAVTLRKDPTQRFDMRTIRGVYQFAVFESAMVG